MFFRDKDSWNVAKWPLRLELWKITKFPILHSRGYPALCNERLLAIFFHNRLGGQIYGSKLTVSKILLRLYLAHQVLYQHFSFYYGALCMTKYAFFRHWKYSKVVQKKRIIDFLFRETLKLTSSSFKRRNDWFPWYGAPCMTKPPLLSRFDGPSAPRSVAHH